MRKTGNQVILLNKIIYKILAKLKKNKKKQENSLSEWSYK